MATMADGHERQPIGDSARRWESPRFPKGAVMAIKVQVKDVNLPRHLVVFPNADRIGDDRVRMEVYTGYVVVNYAVTDPLGHEDVVSFVPVSKETVQPYGEAGDILDITVTAAPSSVNVKDTESIAAVDSADVALEAQLIGGTAQRCLVLKAKIAAGNANLIAFAYQVTVKSKTSDLVNPIQLAPTKVPA
jgi:hypothetical protein